MEAVSKIHLHVKFRYYFKLCRLNLDLKSASEDACLRSTGKLFHNWAPLYENEVAYWQNELSITNSKKEHFSVP